MKVEINQARMTFRNGGCSRERAANISRLTFEHVRQMAAGWGFSEGRHLERVEAAPLRLALNAMSDRQVAHAAARVVLRAAAAVARIELGI